MAESSTFSTPSTGITGPTGGKGGDVIAGLALSKARLNRRKRARKPLSEKPNREIALSEDDTERSTLLSTTGVTTDNERVVTMEPKITDTVIEGQPQVPVIGTGDMEGGMKENDEITDSGITRDERDNITEPVVTEDQPLEEGPLPNEDSDGENPLTVIVFSIQYGRPLKAKYSLMSLAVRLTFLDKMTGNPWEKSSTTHAAVSYYETDNPNVNYLLPVMTKSCQLTMNNEGLLVANWYDDIIYYESYDHLFNEQIVLMIELLNISKQAPPTLIGWGHLFTNHLPLDQTVGVTLYKPPKRWKYMNNPQLSYLLNLHNPSIMSLVLYINISIKHDFTKLIKPDLRSTTPISPEQSVRELNRRNELMQVGDEDVVVRWGRLPGQPCAITDVVTIALSVGRGGCSFARFSPSGRYLSIAGNNENNRFSLYIYKVLEWKLLSVLPTDDGIIYDISWTNDEQTIVIASSSGLCYVSDGACTDGILPHPSYVYCCRWVELDGRVPMVVTGCYDGTLRLWKRNQVCHTHSLTNNSHVIKMTYDKRQCVLYTVTNDSTISSWSINDRDKLELIKHVNLKDLEMCQIRHFRPLPWSNQFLINAPRSPTPLSIIDLRIGSIKIKMSPVSDTVTTSCVSPCGNYIIGISQSSIVYFWNSSNGELMKQFKCHYLHSPAIFCLYHPFDHLLVCGGLGFDQRTIVLSNK